MQIFVRTTGGRTITIDLDAHCSVSGLKDLIRDKEDAGDNFALIFAGTQMEDDKKVVDDYKIKAESKSHGTPRICFSLDS